MVDQIELAADRPAWERQDGETDGQWRNFNIYLGLGRFRSLDEVAIAINPAKQGRKRVACGSLNEDSRANRWVERVRAWDDHVLNMRREQQLEHMKHDLVDAADHARQIREDALIDYRLFVENIRLLLTSLEGQTSVKAKDLRELAQARDRLKELARDVFFGLDHQQDRQDDHLDQLDPDLADLIARVMAEHGKSRRDDG